MNTPLPNSSYLSSQTVYIVMNVITAILCIIEFIRKERHLHLMNKAQIATKEPFVYNLYVAIVITLILLVARCVIQALQANEIHMITMLNLLNFLPIIVYIYSLRLMNALIWEQYLCPKYNIQPKGLHHDKHTNHL